MRPLRMTALALTVAVVGCQSSQAPPERPPKPVVARVTLHVPEMV